MFDVTYRKILFASILLICVPLTYTWGQLAQKEDLYLEYSYNYINWDPLTGSPLEFGTNIETQHVRIVGLHHIWAAIFESIGLSYKELSWHPYFSNVIKYEYYGSGSNSADPLNSSVVDDAQEKSISTEGTEYISNVTLYNEPNDLTEAIFGSSDYFVPYSLFIQDVMVSIVQPTEKVIFTGPEGIPLKIEKDSDIYMKIAYEQEEVGMVLKIGGLLGAENWSLDLLGGQFTATYSKPTELPFKVTLGEDEQSIGNVEQNPDGESPDSSSENEGILMGMPKVSISGTSSGGRFRVDTESFIFFIYHKTDAGQGTLDIGGAANTVNETSDTPISRKTDMEYTSVRSDVTLVWKLGSIFHLAINGTSIQRSLSSTGTFGEGLQLGLSEYSDQISVINGMMRLVW